MEKKFFTFLSCRRTLNQNDEEYVGVSTKLRLSNFKDKEINGSKLVTARASISNRERLLSEVLKTDIVADENNNVWIDVNFWGKNAENISKFLGERTTATLFIVGAMSCRTYEKTSGEGQGIAISIRVDDWTYAEGKKE